MSLLATFPPTLRPLVVCLMLMLVLAGCDSRQQKTVKIGFVGCLAGKCSDLGTSGRDGLLLAVDEINNQGGFLNSENERVHIEVVSASTRTVEGDFSVKPFQDLVAQGVVAVIGPMTSQAGVLLKPEADAAQTILLSPTVSTTKLSGLDDYFLRVYPTCDLTAPALATFAMDVDGLKNFVIAYDEINVAFVDPWVEYFSQTVTEHGAQIVGLQPLSESQPMISSAKQIYQLQPDGILIIASAYQTGLLIQQLEKLDNSAHIFGTEWSTAKGLEGYSGRALEGSFFVSSFDQASQAEKSLKFESAYQARFNQTPTFAAKFGYEALQLLLAGLTKTTKKENLKEAFVNLGPVAGLQSDLKLNQFGDIDRTVYIKQFKNGSFNTVARYANGKIESTLTQ